MSHLGVAMAQAGQKTLIVDADLRKPAQHRTFANGGQSNGLAEVLAGTVALDEAIRPTRIQGMDVLEAGQIVPNPSELLGSDALRERLRSCCRQIRPYPRGLPAGWALYGCPDPGRPLRLDVTGAPGPEILSGSHPTGAGCFVNRQRESSRRGRERRGQAGHALQPPGVWCLRLLRWFQWPTDGTQGITGGGREPEPQTEPGRQRHRTAMVRLRRRSRRTILVRVSGTTSRRQAAADEPAAKPGAQPQTEASTPAENGRKAE